MKKTLFLILALIFAASAPALATSNFGMASIMGSDPAANGTETIHVKCEYSTCVQNTDVPTTVTLSSLAATKNNVIQTACMDYINTQDNGGDPNCGGTGTIANKNNISLRGGFVA